MGKRKHKKACKAIGLPHLPNELWELILVYVDVWSIKNILLTSKKFYDLCNRETFWKRKLETEVQTAFVDKYSYREQYIIFAKKLVGEKYHGEVAEKLKEKERLLNQLKDNENCIADIKNKSIVYVGNLQNMLSRSMGDRLGITSMPKIIHGIKRKYNLDVYRRIAEMTKFTICHLRYFVVPDILSLCTCSSKCCLNNFWKSQTEVHNKNIKLKDFIKLGLLPIYIQVNEFDLILIDHPSHNIKNKLSIHKLFNIPQFLYVYRDEDKNLCVFPLVFYTDVTASLDRDELRFLPIQCKNLIDTFNINSMYDLYNLYGTSEDGPYYGPFEAYIDHEENIIYLAKQ